MNDKFESTTHGSFILQHRIYRQDLKNNPETFYIFGDNLLRKGMGGQAGEMRGEKNAFGIPTKKTPSNDSDAFFTDEEYERNVKFLEKHFDIILSILNSGFNVVFPSDGIGTGLSAMDVHCPKTLNFIEKHVKVLREEYP